METVKNIVSSVNEGVANMAASAQEALGGVHDKVGGWVPAAWTCEHGAHEPLCCCGALPMHGCLSPSLCALQAVENAQTAPQKVDEVRWSCVVECCGVSWHLEPLHACMHACNEPTVPALEHLMHINPR